jgi:Tfp pilus assembly protein PilO
MLRNFEWLFAGGSGMRGARFWLQFTGALLALLNGVALFFYLDPPGGSRRQLSAESLQIRNQIAATRGQTQRLSSVAAKVQLAGTESSDFETKYFLPQRTAYAAVISEIQRMAKASGLQERDAIFNEEPVEGSADLSVLNTTASYEGTYANLMRFVYEVDHSPMLLMLENLQAAPQQKGGQIATSIRFQAIVQEQPVASAAGGRL